VYILLENNNTEKLISRPKCGNLFHHNRWVEYVLHKNKSNETPIINTLPNTNVYNTNRFTYNPNLLTPVRSVSEVNNLYIGSRFISHQRPQYIFYPPNQIFIS